MRRRAPATDDATLAVFAVLNRDVPLPVLEALILALRPDHPEVPLAETAIAFDTNVLLRLSNHRQSTDIVDYLRTSHSGPLILPGQVIQEFWNNQFQAVDSLASSVKKKFDALRNEVSKVDDRFGDFSDRLDGMLKEFDGSFGYIYDDATLRRVHSLLETMKVKAKVPFATRSYFTDMAAQRNRTKTPPGFRDDGDGDFFVWVDLLLGLYREKFDGGRFGRVVLVTHDRKLDWSRGGTPHPILSAEVKALTGARLEMWTVDRLAEELLGA